MVYTLIGWHLLENSLHSFRPVNRLGTDAVIVSADLSSYDPLSIVTPLPMYLQSDLGNAIVCIPKYVGVSKEEVLLYNTAPSSHQLHMGLYLFLSEYYLIFSIHNRVHSHRITFNHLPLGSPLYQSVE